MNQNTLQKNRNLKKKCIIIIKSNSWLLSQKITDKIKYGHRNLYYEIMFKYIFNYVLLIYYLLLILTSNIFFKKLNFFIPIHFLLCNSQFVLFKLLGMYLWSFLTADID